MHTLIILADGHIGKYVDGTADWARFGFEAVNESENIEDIIDSIKQGSRAVFLKPIYPQNSADIMANIKQLVNFRNTDEESGLLENESALTVADEALNYIRANFANPSLSMKSVSEKLFISPNYFSAIFKREAGESFSQCLIRTRMENARNLLLTSGFKIFEISKKVGYLDQHYFSHCFKKYYGVSPRELRQAKNEKQL